MTALDKAGLVALAERVEALTGPQFAIESEIYKAVFPHNYQHRLDALKAGPMGPRLSAGDYDGYIVPPAFTADLSTALSMLVPKGCDVCIETVNGKHYASVNPPGGIDSRIMGPIEAATPALALTAAALRALAAGQP